MEVKDELMVVPLLISLVDRKCLLLGVHVQQQVGNAVAVAVLIIIPGRRKGGKENELVFFRLPVFYEGLDGTC